MNTVRYVLHQYSLPIQPLLRKEIKKKSPGSVVKNAEIKRLDVVIRTLSIL